MGFQPHFPFRRLFDRVKMAMKKYGIKALKSMLFSWFAVSLLAALFVSFLLALKVAVSLRQKTYDLQAGKLQNIAETADDLFAEIDSIAYDIMFSDDFLPFNAYSTGYTHVRLSESLQYYIKANSVISDIIIYYTDSLAQQYHSGTHFFTSNGAMDDTLFFYIHPLSSWQKDNVEQFSQSLIKPCSMYPVLEQKKTGTTRYWAYFFPLMLSEGSVNTRGFVTFLLHEDKLIDLLGMQENTPDEQLTIFTSEGVPVFYTGEAPSDALHVFSTGSGMHTTRENVMHYVHSATRGNSYILTVSSHLTPLLSGSFLSFFFPFLLAVAVFGVILLSMMLRRTLLPLAREATERNLSCDDSVVASVISALRSLDEEKYELLYKLEVQQQFFDDQAVLLLLRGAHTEADRERLNAFVQKNAAEYYVVFLVEMLQPAQNGLQPCPAVHMNEYFRLLQPLHDENVHAITLDSPGCFAILAGFSLKNSIHELAEHYCAQLTRAAENALVTVFPGMPVASVWEISASYNTARLLFERRFLLGLQGVITDVDGETLRAGQLMAYPADQEQALLKALGERNPVLITHHLHEIVALLRQSLPIQSVALGICSNLCNHSIAMLRNDQTEKGSMHGAQLSELLTYLNQPGATLAQFEECFLQAVTEICRTNGSAAVAPPFCVQISHYLEQHYDNPLLSLSMIAEHFDVSVGHLSRIYSERYDVTIWQRVDMLRMARAADLLLNTNLPVAEIIPLCGYNTRSNFSRKFKETYGISAAAFREQKSSVFRQA